MNNNNKMDVVKLMPSEIREKYNSVRIDSKYICVMYIVTYEKLVFLELMDTLFGLDEIRISFNIKRQNNMDFLKKISRFVSESNAELITSKSTQIDREVLEKNKNDAQKVKKEIQINNEEVYLVETYIEIRANSEAELLSKSDFLKNLLYTKEIIARTCYFKQKEGYLAMQPLIMNRKLLGEYTENLFLTSGLTCLFPFFIKDNEREDGVILGKSNNAICKLSLLSNKNLNYNMCVFGSSGVGKSFFIKLLIIRNMYKGINQIILDLEGEYKSIVEALGGNVYECANYNPLQIEENFAVKEKDFFEKTINLLLDFLEQKYKWTDAKKAREKIIELYLEYGINEKRESLYEYGNETHIYVSPRYKNEFPKIGELLVKLGLEEKSEYKEKIRKNTKLHCFVVSGNNTDEIQKQIGLMMPKIKSLITEETLLFFDEIWKCISVGKDKQMIEEMYNFFKTLRKRTAGVIAITQDIGDLFCIDNGNFGKSILNNSYTKVFFKMSYTDMDKLDMLIKEEPNIKKNIFGLQRGEAYINQGESKFKLEVIASEFERRLIEGENINEENFSGYE